MKHSLWSGVGLVVSNMIGVGVLISTGFMAQDLSAGPIMLAWCVGAVIAMCGVVAYCELTSAISESGGEYRFLSESFHPFVGCLAGFGSLFLGFSAAIAVDAYAIGSFLNTLVDGPEARLTGALVILAMTVMHGINDKVSHYAQNFLAILKIGAILAFVILGLAMGSHELPTWKPPNSGLSSTWSTIFENQLWIAFAFSGWNAAVYVTGEFREPRRDVTRAMVWGIVSVGLLYLGINWVFLANLSPDQAAAVFHYEETRVTLVHLVANNLWGGVAGTVVFILVMWTLISSISSMMIVGPRVYAAMAQDGFLPKALAARSERPPIGSVILQAAVALVILLNQSIRDTVLAAGAFLMLFSALTALGLFRLQKRALTVDAPRSSGLFARVAAVVYAFAVALILYVGFTVSQRVWYSLSLVAISALVSFAWFAFSAKASPPGSTKSG